MNILNERFDHTRIPEVFENIKKTERADIFSRVVYSIYGRGGFVGDIMISKDDKTVHYFRDNFPGPKIYRTSDIRIRTFRDFINDLERVGFTDIKLTNQIMEMGLEYTPTTKESLEGKSNDLTMDEAGLWPTFNPNPKISHIQ